MIEWPELDEVKQVLDITSDDWDGEETSGGGPTRLTRLLDAAIARVKQDVGNWDEETDMPDAALSQAALRMCELLALRPDAAVESASDPTYLRLLAGHRLRFSFS